MLIVLWYQDFEFNNISQNNATAFSKTSLWDKIKECNYFHNFLYSLHSSLKGVLYAVESSVCYNGSFGCSRSYKGAY